MGTTPDKTPTAPKAKKSAARAVHLLVQTGEDGKITALENFSGELDARRRLDGRPSWQYVKLTPGSTYSVNELGGVSTDG